MFSPGEEIQGYRIERMLGSGAFSSVWLAVDPAGQDVALKVLNEVFYDDRSRTGPSVAERFLEEARLLREAHVDGLVEVRDVIQDPERRLIAMALEKVEGEPLSAAALSMDVPELLEVFAATATTLGALHQRGIVHRDVKSDNILIGWTPEGRPVAKLIDLGVAKDLAASASQPTGSGVMVGTLRALAPETFGQIEGEPEAVTGSVDQWALGIVIFETLSGQSPFKEKGAIALMSAIRNEATPAIKLHTRFGYGETPAQLRAIVDRALAKAPADRFETMEAMAQALGNVAAMLRMAATGGPDRDITWTGRMPSPQPLVDGNFRATPHGEDEDTVEATLQKGVRVVELSQPPEGFRNLAIESEMPPPRKAPPETLRRPSRPPEPPPTPKDRTAMWVSVIIAATILAFGAGWILARTG